MYSASVDGTATIYDLSLAEKPKFLGRLTGQHTCGLNAITCNTTYIATGGDDFVTLWNIEKKKSVLTFKEHTSSVTSCHLHGDYLATASADETLKCHDIRSGRCISTMRTHSGPILTCAIPPDSSIHGYNDMLLLSGGIDGSIRIWDPIAGICLNSVITPSPVSCLSISPNSKYVISSNIGKGGFLYRIKDVNGKIKLNHVLAFDKHENVNHLLGSTFLSIDDSSFVLYGTERDTIMAYELSKTLKFYESNTLHVGKEVFTVSTSRTGTVAVGGAAARIAILKPVLTTDDADDVSL